MTPEEHNKYLGWAHIIHGGLFLFLMFFMTVMMWMMFTTMPGPPQGPPPVFFGIMWAFVLGIYGLMSLPNLIAGYALLKKKSWAKMAAIIAGVVSAMSAPIGTAVAVYTFWFLFSEPGKSLYDRPRYGLPPMPASWEQRTTQQQSTTQQQERERQYTPPSTPPDWR
ncbi:MAG TPA: hypothetical protein VI306_20855 [Pyrinomonadaceae bacterium]